MVSLEYKTADPDRVADGEVLTQPEQLVLSDTRWLESLRGQPIDAVWLSRANEIAGQGSVRMGARSSEPQRAPIMQAREEFYGELLGWAHEDHPLHGTYTHFFTQKTRKAPPIKTVVATQRFLANKQIDPMSLLVSNPSLLGLSVERLEDRFTVLEGLGLDPVKMINTIPRSKLLLTWKLDKIEERFNERVDNLYGLGVSDGAKAISSNPGLLTSSWEHVLDGFSRISELGIDASKVVRKYPTVLTYSAATILEKYDNLERMGLDAATVINKFPTTMTMHSESVEKRFRHIQSLGRVLGWQESAANLINASPQMLSYSSKKLLAHARIFAEHGQPGTTISQVQSMCIIPLEYHLLSLVQSDDYTYANIQKAYKAERGNHKERVVEILAEPGNRRRIGQKVVRAYRRYAERT